MAESRHILITRPIETDLEDMFRNLGYQLDNIAFIATSSLNDETTRSKIRSAAGRSHTVVFTSASAVQAVAECITGVNMNWETYAIGHATLERIRQMLPATTIKGTAPDAVQLAEHIIADMPSASIIFFCGDQRREELPRMLRHAGLDLEELVVYQTIETPVLLEPVHDDLMFFSPSAVKSYFSVNRPKQDAVFFAIGATTAAAIRENAGNEIIISPEPSARELAHAVIRYHAEH